ncbi:MAG: CRISPR-associated DxTHG motif protein, partial [Clostridiales bacterium]|nr:CRISPR-associated DxTHG motif protein [Clostridiales bacterium]
MERAFRKRQRIRRKNPSNSRQRRLTHGINYVKLFF